MKKNIKYLIPIVALIIILVVLKITGIIGIPMYTQDGVKYYLSKNNTIDYSIEKEKNGDKIITTYIENTMKEDLPSENIDHVIYVDSKNIVKYNVLYSDNKNPDVYVYYVKGMKLKESFEVKKRIEFHLDIYGHITESNEYNIGKQIIYKVRKYQDKVSMDDEYWKKVTTEFVLNDNQEINYSIHSNEENGAYMRRYYNEGAVLQNDFENMKRIDFNLTEDGRIIESIEYDLAQNQSILKIYRNGTTLEDKYWLNIVETIQL